VLSFLATDGIEALAYDVRSSTCSLATTLILESENPHLWKTNEFKRTIEGICKKAKFDKNPGVRQAARKALEDMSAFFAPFLPLFL